MTTRTANQIKFGIEIECMLPASVQISVGGYHNGLAINWAPAGWNAQGDGSIRAQSGYKPVEIVSPPMCGEDGLAQIYYMIETINELGGRVNDSCGLHVHVDANGMTQNEVMAVRRAFLKYENAFYGLSGRLACYRLQNHYSKSSKISSVNDRYQGINLLNWIDPSPRRQRNNARTIEIRAWAGTLNPDEIMTAVYMAVALVASGGIENEQTITQSFFAAHSFIDNVWSDIRNLIIPEEAIDELAEILTRKCEESRI